VESPATVLPRGDIIQQLVDRILSAPVVPAREDQRVAVRPLTDAFLSGLGNRAPEILSGYLDRAAALVIQLLTEEQRKFVGKPQYENAVELVEFDPSYMSRPTVSSDRVGVFTRGVGYEGWRRSLYFQAWFDSSPERDLANILDGADEVSFWVRLQRGDLPILWHGTGNWYTPDFLAVDTDTVHWIIEVKMDKEMKTEEVQEKRQAATRWANYVSTNAEVGQLWRYLLVSESDIRTSKGSWPALERLGTA
jgi:type III restriction enzyme